MEFEPAIRATETLVKADLKDLKEAIGILETALQTRSYHKALMEFSVGDDVEFIFPTNNGPRTHVGTYRGVAADPAKVEIVNVRLKYRDNNTKNPSSGVYVVSAIDVERR